MNSNFSVSDNGRTLTDAFRPFSTVVVEISGGKQVNRPELMSLDPCFAQLLSYAAKEDDRLVPMASEDFDIYYLFIRTDDLPGTYEALARLEELVTDGEFYNGTLVYMDRLEHDSFNIGEKILAKSGTPYIYTDGERTASYIQPKRGGRNFKADYTLAQLFDYCRGRIMGQDEQLKKALYLIDRFVESMAAGRECEAPSFFLTAPSGSGKTELYRAVKDFFRCKGIPVPVVNIDLSQMTAAGYKGNNVDVIADAILSDSDYLTSRCAICFLDEADKKMMPDTESSGENFNAKLQANLLRMLEGCELKGETVRETWDEEYIRTVDTSRVLFILMGSFQEVRDRRSRGRRPAGFGTQQQSGAEKDFSADITLEEMISAGMLEEIAGRVSRVINFRPIPKPMMEVLLTHKAASAGAARNTEIILTQTALDQLVAQAYTPLGIRRPMNLISELIDDALTEAAFSGELYQDGVNIVVILSLTRAAYRKRVFKLPPSEEEVRPSPAA